MRRTRQYQAAPDFKKPYPEIHLTLSGCPLPSIQDFDWLIILGGDMGVHDEETFSGLMREKTFIREAIQADKRILGICLGAQLIAHVLGAAVRKR